MTEFYFFFLPETTLVTFSRVRTCQWSELQLVSRVENDQLQDLFLNLSEQSDDDKGTDELKINALCGDGLMRICYVQF